MAFIPSIQLTWYGHVQRMAEGRLPKIALKWMPKQKRTRKTEEDQATLKSSLTSWHRNFDI
jgi:hypothetical protein